MRKAVSLVVFLWSATATAFLPVSPSRSSATPRFESTAASSVSTSSTSASSASLSSEYAAAFEQAEQALRKSIDDEKMLLPLLHFCEEYMSANEASYARTKDPVSSPEQTTERILNGIQLGMKHGLVDKYTFGVSHTALRGKDPEAEDGNTYDFYSFGCDFFRPCMDMEKSVVNGMEHLETAMKQLEQGDNVVFFANHQSEADPQVVSCCLEKVGFGAQAEEMVYVAGHKVTSDALAIPFSMGRNLICIHSKKYMESNPATKAAKQRQNLMAMGAMLEGLRKGGRLLWVAPSGGRDRRNVETGEIPIAPFDSKTIDMFRLMGNKSKKPTHFYPMAMVSYELCPPPDYTESGVGEQRNVRFVPVGISISPEVTSEGGLEKRHEFCEAAFEQCEKDYAQLRAEVFPPSE